MNDKTFSCLKHSERKISCDAAFLNPKIHTYKWLKMSISHISMHQMMSALVDNETTHRVLYVSDLMHRLDFCCM